MRPRILLVDDHEIVRKGIRQLLEGPTRDVCGEAANGDEAVQKVRELKPDLVVMDHLMPGMSGIQASQKIRETAPAIKIVILTMDDEIIKEAKTLGVDACVDKASLVSDLQRTITRVLLGHEPPEGW